MEEFLTQLQNISLKLLPLIGCVALIFLIVLMRKLMTLLHDLTLSLGKVNKTIDDANMTIEQFQQPLQTVKNVAVSIDKANAWGNKVVVDSFTFLAENLANIVEYFKKVFAKPEKEIEDISKELKDE